MEGSYYNMNLIEYKTLRIQNLRKFCYKTNIHGPLEYVSFNKMKVYNYTK